MSMMPRFEIGLGIVSLLGLSAIIAGVVGYYGNSNLTNVVGRVIDLSGSPVAQYPVIVKGPDKSAVVLTNKDGQFSVYDLSPGDYHIALANEPSADTFVSVDKKYPWWDLRGYTPAGVDNYSMKQVGDLRVSGEDMLKKK